MLIFFNEKTSLVLNKRVQISFYHRHLLPTFDKHLACYINLSILEGTVKPIAKRGGGE